MARGKKNEKEITTEERLEQALVPAEEQPYSVPENWCWTKIEHIASVKGGKRLPKGRQFSKNPTEHPYLRVTDFENRSIILEQIKYIDISTFCEIKNYTISAKDIYISIAGTIGKVGIIPTFLDGANLTENAAKITDIKGIDQKFLMWLLESEFAQRQIKESTISTTQPKLALFRIEKINIPLPPLAEQQRIVDRIESLFAKLDEAKEKAQAVVDGFEARKAAILHKAFTGELTAKWRKKSGLEINTWRKKPLKDICKYMRAGGDKPQDFSNIKDKEHQIPVVANGISDDGIIGFTGILKEEGGSVTVSGRGTIGFSVYRDYPYYPVVRLIVLAPQNYIRGLYLKYYFDAFSEKGTGSSIPQLTVPMIKEKQVLFPTLDEQDVILDIIDLLLKEEQQAKETAETVLDQIEVMKKSILARAFRGELGTNEPAEESGVELLKQIL